MPKVPVSTILNDVRTVWLLDNDVAGGQVLTNAALLPAFGAAYRRLYNAMAMVQTPRILRFFYTNLPAYTTILDPASVYVTDMAEPVFVEERGALTTYAISSTNTASPIQVTTSSPYTLGINGEVVISGVQGTQAPWGRWFGTVVDSLNFTLNGSTSDGNAGTGGTATVSSEMEFTDVDAQDRVTDQTPDMKLLYYFWDEGVFKFRGAIQQRQLRITYWASGAAPSNVNTVIGIDDCENFLGCATAAYAAKQRGWDSTAQQLFTQAFGPGGEASIADGSAGLLRETLLVQVRSLQRMQRRRQPFRPSRQNLNWLWM